MMLKAIALAQSWWAVARRDERGLNTAELLGNAALAIVALIAIWAVLRQAGIDIVEEITTRILDEDLDSGG